MEQNIVYCTCCEKEMKENVGICDDCIWGIGMGIIDPPEGY